MATSNHPDLTEALRVMADVRPLYDEAASMYEGVVDEVLASEKLRDIFGDATARKFRINYARTPCDVLLERTKVQGFTVANSAQLAAIEQVWQDNELGLEAKDVHLKAYEFGDSYLIAWPEEDDPDFPGKVSAYAHDPRHVRVFYDPQKPRRKRMAVHRWQEPGSEANGLGEGIWQRVNVYYPDRVEPWVSDRPIVTAAGTAVFSSWDDTYVPYLDPEEGEQWPLPTAVEGVIPVFHFRTARPYGRPEHADAYGPQYGINKLYVSLMGAVDHAVLPQRWVTTDSALDQVNPADAFAEAVGDTIDTEAEGLDAGSSMETGPGNVWLLSGQNVKAGQFNAADSDNFVGPMSALVDQLYDVTDMPANRRHGAGGQQPSGDSQRMSEVPLNNKTADRQAQFGVTWHEFFQFVCDVNNLGETDAQVAWSPPDTFTDRDSWETAKLQLTSGVKWDQVMRERGYSSDWIEENEAYASAVVSALVGGDSEPVVEADSLIPPST